MAIIWDEIIEYSLRVKGHGDPYLIHFTDLKQAAPKELGTMSPVDALNWVLVKADLFADFDKGTGLVTVRRR